MKTVSKVTYKHATKYFNTYVRPNNAYLVIVGDGVNQYKHLSQNCFHLGKISQ